MRPCDENWVFGMVADEFHAAEREMAFEAGDITGGCGAISCETPTATREDDEFSDKRVEDLVKITQASGFGRPVVSDGPVIGAKESVAEVPVGPCAETGRDVAPTSGVVVAAAHTPKCAKNNNDASRVDPPEKGGPIPGDTPGLVTVASPCIFLNWGG